MGPRNYYYLVSGLPEIVLEQSKAPFSVVEFVTTLRESLHPEDYQEVQLILLPYDEATLLSLARKTEAPVHPLASFTRPEMEERLKEPGLLPAYFYRFFEAFRQEEPIWPGMSWENQLTRLRYDHLQAQTDGFLRAWFAFEQDLKNVLAAWNLRHYGLPPAGQLIGDNEVTGNLEKSHARDFGLSAERPFVDRLLNTFERDNLLERERTIDRIKWNFIDESNTFHYFTNEVVLGYLLKLIMLERWLQLDAESGRQALDRKIKALREGAMTQVQKTD